MDPLSALGLASNIIQITEFTGKLISQSKEIYRSADGTLSEHAILEEAARNLRELLSMMKQAEPKQCRTAWSLKRQSKAVKQLLSLSQETNEVTEEIIERLTRLKAEGSTNAWKSVEQALRSAWSHREVQQLQTKLDHIRKQVDTALLVSLRDDLTALNESKFALQDDVAAFMKDNQRMHHEILSACAKKSPSIDATDFAGFSERINSMAKSDLETSFCKMITARLQFAELPDRFESIPEAHQQTFNWLFDQPREHSEHTSWDSFTDWLEDKDGQIIYWITGKPGSGKSTLMKFLFRDPRTKEHLKHWAGATPLICAGFFFWNSGTVMQMSRLGLLQSLLYESTMDVGCDEDNSQYILWLFVDRWKQFEAFGGGREPFTWLELRRVFDRLLSDTTKNFFFLIDGLDEFDGDAKEMTELILSSSKWDHVKVCTASRPWVVFEKTFEDRPSLLLEHLTGNDIQAYVISEFCADKEYLRLERTDPDFAEELAEEVVSKSTVGHND